MPVSASVAKISSSPQMAALDAEASLSEVAAAADEPHPWVCFMACGGAKVDDVPPAHHICKLCC